MNAHIISVRVGNFLAFSETVELSMFANKKIKRMLTNTYDVKSLRIVKSACLYGPNNVGKTCLARAILSIKNILLSVAANVSPNIYSNSKVCEFGITFSVDEHVYEYNVKYDGKQINGSARKFVYEKFSEHILDGRDKGKVKTIFLKDFENHITKFPENKEIENAMSLVSGDNLLVYVLNQDKYSSIKCIRNLFRSFAEKIEVIDMNNIPIEKTLGMLKKDNNLKKRVVDLISRADVEIEDYTYKKPTSTSMTQMRTPLNMPQEEVLMVQKMFTELLGITSTHKGKEVPSIFFDSTGTKKIAALAGYVVEALEQGKILVVDELDSSLHYKLTRAIVAMFNNIANKNAQLIFTAHDIMLLDCKRLFRKDQIHFVNRNDEGNVEIYSLDDFKSTEGFRSESDVINHYDRGDFGAIADPDLIGILLEGGSDE